LRAGGKRRVRRTDDDIQGAFSFLHNLRSRRSIDHLVRLGQTSGCHLPGSVAWLACGSSLDTDLTLVIILFRLSEPEGFFEVVRPRRLSPEHDQHA